VKPVARVGMQTPFAIFLLALLVRLLWIAVVHNDSLIGDAGWYHARAVSLTSGQGYSIQGTPTAYFPPGYAFFLALLYALAGPTVFVAKLSNALLGACTAWLVFVFAERTYGRPVAVVAATLCAIHPNQVFYSSVLMSETLLAFLLMAVLCLVVAPPQHPVSSRAMLVGGLVLGAGCLVKPASIAVAVGVAAYWLLWERKPVMQVGRRLAILLAGCALVLAPWAVRNQTVMHHGVLISTNGGVNFWMAQLEGTYREPPPEIAAGWGRTNATPELEVRAERRAYREGIDFLRREPLTPVRSLPKKLVRFFYADIDGLLANAALPNVRGPRDILRVADHLPIAAPTPIKTGLFLLAQFFYMGVLLAAAYGAFRAVRRGHGPAIALQFVLVAWILFHTLVFFPLGRYRLPVMPMIFVLAAGGIVSIRGPRPKQGPAA